MAQLTTRRQYAASQPLLKSDLDAFIDDIETFINVVGISNDNIQDAAITASTVIIDNTIINGKFANGAFTTAKITDSNVTTAKLVDGSVTAAKIDNLAVTTDKLADNAITTAKIADGVLTLDKFALSSTSGSIVTDTRPNSQAAFIYTKQLEISLTTTSSDSYVIFEGVSGYYIMSNSSSGSSVDRLGINFLISRKLSGATTATMVASFTHEENCRVSTLGARTVGISVPATAIRVILPSPGTGTYIYSLYIAPSSSNAVSVSDTVFNCRKVMK